jgi:hypothetical protein
MGALFIAFEHELPDADLSAHAPAMVEHEELLADIADELHVPPLMHFFHKSAEDMEEFVEDEVEGQDDAEDAQELWFDAEEGRNSIDSLLHHFDDHPAETPDGVTDELRAFDKILEQAEEHQVRWHFEMDF